MGEVFAGFVCGYLLALLSTPLLAVLLLDLRAGSATLARLLPPGVSAIGFSVLLHGALLLMWTAMGILLGLLLLAMDETGRAAGSLNAAFTLFVVALVIMIAAPVVIMMAPLRRLTLACAVAAILLFGWLMPYVAEWSRFDRVDRPALEFIPFTASADGERISGWR